MLTRESIVKRILIGLLIVLSVLSVGFLLKGWMDGHFDSPETMRAYIESFGLLGPVVLALFQMFQVVLPVLPGMVGCAVGAALFGTVGGFICNYIGITAGSLLAFWLARRYGIQIVTMMIPEKKCEHYMEWIATKKSFILLLWLSILLPLAPDDFLCYFSGLTKMSFRKFAWIIIAAKPWCILAYSIFFEKLF